MLDTNGFSGIKRKSKMDKKKILRWIAVPIVAVVAWSLANWIEFGLLQSLLDWLRTLHNDNWFCQALARLANSKFPVFYLWVFVYGFLVVCAIVATVRVAPSHKRRVAVVAAVVATATPIVQELCLADLSSVSAVLKEVARAWYWIGMVLIGSLAACKVVYDNYDR